MESRRRLYYPCQSVLNRLNWKTKHSEVKNVTLRIRNKAARVKNKQLGLRSILPNTRRKKIKSSQNKTKILEMNCVPRHILTKRASSVLRSGHYKLTETFLYPGCSLIRWPFRFIYWVPLSDDMRPNRTLLRFRLPRFGLYSFRTFHGTQFFSW